MKLEDKLFISTSCIAGKNNYEEAFNFILNANIYNIEISGNHIHSNNDALIKLINNYKKKIPILYFIIIFLLQKMK